MSAPTFVYAAEVERVVDGDTFDVVLDLGLRLSYRVRLRLLHVDAPEVKTDEGKAVRDEMRAMLPPGTPVIVRTEKPDKYGRVLARVEHAMYGDLSDLLLRRGWSVSYEGGHRG